MKKLLLFTACFLLLSWGQTLRAQAFTFTPGSMTYTENFDGMGATGTAFITGWTAIRYAGTGAIGATLSMVATDINTTVVSGNVYNVGTPTDRALGSISSGSTYTRFGASFVNNSGAAVTSLSLAGVMEQWKSGSNETVDEATVFEYSTDATDLSTGTWTAVSSFDLVEKLTTTTAAVMVDGNLPANKTAISASIPLNWANSGTLWIRWSDPDNYGSDGLYAIDDLSITATTTVSVKDLSNSTVSVYPNPSHGKLFITNASKNTQEIAVFNAVGNQVAATVSDQGVISLDIAEQAKGLYFVKITNEADKSVQIKKIVLK